MMSVGQQARARRPQQRSGAARTTFIAVVILCLLDASIAGAQSIPCDVEAPPSVQLGELFHDVQMKEIFHDSLAFAGCKMIRRIVGFAHVADFDSIPDARVRADCESGALALARTLLTHPGQFRSMRDVIDAVPRVARP